MIWVTRSTHNMKSFQFTFDSMEIDKFEAPKMTRSRKTHEWITRNCFKLKVILDYQMKGNNEYVFLEINVEDLKMVWTRKGNVLIEILVVTLSLAINIMELLIWIFLDLALKIDFGTKIFQVNLSSKIICNFIIETIQIRQCFFFQFSFILFCSQLSNRNNEL
jgi:hypothetical protein